MSAVSGVFRNLKGGVAQACPGVHFQVYIFKGVQNLAYFFTLNKLISTNFFSPPKGEVQGPLTYAHVFSSVRLSVCLSVCQHDNS